MTLRAVLAVLGITALCVSPVFAHAQTPSTTLVTAPAPKAVLQDAEKEKDIRQIITLTGADKLGQQMLDQMMPEIQKIAPQIPDAFWQEFRRKASVSKLNQLTLTVYDKHYSREDIKGLIQFYQTPLGQKVIATTPELMRDVQTISRAWGEEIARDIFRELEAKNALKHAPAKPKTVKPAKAPAPKQRKAVSR